MTKLITITDVVYRTSLPATVVKRMVAATELPAPRAIEGKAMLWAEADIEHWIETRPVAEISMRAKIAKH